jgi:hypothetical protein
MSDEQRWLEEEEVGRRMLNLTRDRSQYCTELSVSIGEHILLGNFC